jgi:hypothetical protein
MSKDKAKKEPMKPSKKIIKKGFQKTEWQGSQTTFTEKGGSKKHGK